jgi:pimeloyl-ACP methyl ester carboxylesterase
VTHLAAHLGLERFSLLGVSGGGPYALACAAALPDRVRRVALVAGAAPLSDPEVFALLSARQRLVLGSMIGSLRLLRGFVWGLSRLPDLMRVLVLGAALGGLSPADLRLIRSQEIARQKRRLPADASNAPFGRTPDGPAWDGHLHSRPWGFDLASIRVPVDLWYADDDRIVPARMGRYLAGRLPVTTARFLPDDGHISLIIGKAAEYLRALCVEDARAGAA